MKQAIKQEKKSVEREAKEKEDLHSVKTSWEIIGTIKSCPQDFVVQEIGGRIPSKKNSNKKETLSIYL